MNKVFGTIALFVLVCSLLVHASTFVPSLTPASNVVFVLHGLAILCFFPMVMTLSRFKKEYPDIFTRLNFWKHLSLFIPVPLRFLCQAAMVYAFVNFMLCVGSFEGGTPREAVPGQWELQNKGRTIRKITAAEAQAHEARMLRGFSGHWIVFSLFPAVFFLAAVPAIEAQKKIEQGA